MESEITTRCTVCRQEFTDEQLEGATACPSCDTTSVPCAVENDVTIQINWHELRILGIWAENWARHMKETGEHATGPGVISAIAQAIQAQHPDKPPITLTGELREIRKEFPKMETNIDLSPNLILIKGGNPKPEAS